MRNYGQIQIRFWASPDIIDLSPTAKLLAAYLLTSKHSNCLGCYRLPFEYVKADLNLDIKTIQKGFSELFRNGFVRHDEGLNIALIPKYIKWNPIQNANVGKKLLKELELIPKTFKYYSELLTVVERYGKHLPNGFETLCKQFRIPEPEPEPEPEPKDFCSEPEKPSDSKQESPVFLKIPTNKKGEEFLLTEKQVADWSPVYPAVNVAEEVRRAAAWLDANPAKRKTKRGMKAFLVRWLGNAQDKGGTGIKSNRPAKNTGLDWLKGGS